MYYSIYIFYGDFDFKYYRLILTDHVLHTCDGLSINYNMPGHVSESHRHYIYFTIFWVAYVWLWHHSGKCSTPYFLYTGEFIANW